MLAGHRLLRFGRDVGAWATAASRHLARIRVPETLKICPARLVKPGLLTAAILALGLAATGPAVVIHHLYTLPLPTGFEDPRRVALDLVSSGGTVFAVRGVSHGRTVELGRCPTTWSMRF